MLLIMSAEYVSPEFEAEIGKIPLCMLPIGNKKLIELQVQAIRHSLPDEKIILALPESYELKIDEVAMLTDLSVTLRVVPDSFNFANAVLYLINTESDKHADDIKILYGHTLINELPSATDAIVVAQSAKQYNWHTEKTNNGETVVWAGYFAFSEAITLTKVLALSKGKFVKAIQRYRKVKPMQLTVVDIWYDCGHLNTFFNARAKITTQRSFNTLRIGEDIVTKTSDDNRKIQAEALWFANLPPSLKKFIPQLIDHGILSRREQETSDNDKYFYSLEYLPLLPLNELFVHGRNPLAFWQTIFGLVEKFLNLSVQARTFTEAEKQVIKYSSDNLYRDKTLSRLAEFSTATQFDLHQVVSYAGKPLGTVQQICEHCIDKMLALPCVYAVLHGDLCFSNILFDARGQRIKVIDPRGLDKAGNFSNLGNQTYDVTKLTHSVIGLYDFIIAGRYQLTVKDQDYAINFELDKVTLSIQQAFMTEYFRDHISVQALMPGVVLLFLSMLPLHSDRPDRQQAMLVNAFRLYSEYVV